MQKTICDLCGSDATDKEFVLPEYDEWEVTSMGKAIAKMTIGIKQGKFNLCIKCQSNFADYVKHMRDIYNIK